MLEMDFQNSDDQKRFSQLQINKALSNFKVQLGLLKIYCVIFLFIFNTIIFSLPMSLWVLSFGLLILVGLFINHKLIVEKNTSYATKNIFLKFSSLFCGFFLLLSAYLLDSLIVIEHSLATNIVLIIFILLCYASLQVSALFFLTNNYKLFLCFVIPTLIPLSRIHFIELDIRTQLIFAIPAYLYAATLLFVGYKIHKSKLAFITDELEIQKLINTNLESQEYTYRLSLQLQEEQKRADAITQELQLHNNLLEEKVQERTFDIERINARLERSHQNLEMAHETAGIASWDWDISNRLIETSNFMQIFGYNIKNMDHYIHHLNEFIHKDDIENVKNEMRNHLRGFTNRYEAKYRLFHQTEQWIWVHDMGRVVQRDLETRKPLRMVGIRRNINNEKRSEENLKLSASVFKKAAQGIFILDEKLNYADANPYFLELIGLTEKQLIGRHVFDIARSNKPELQQIHLTILRQLMKMGEFEGEIIEELVNGKELPLWMHINSIKDNQNKISQYIGIVTDLTERKTSEKRLSYLQTYDPLTDLPNRYYFNNFLHGLLTNHFNDEKKFAVIRINLDRFRYYNELLNHHGGDELLKQVAHRLRRTNADATVIARLNADDFSVIVDISQNNQNIIEHCQKLIDTFQEPFTINEQKFIMTISIGVALFPEHGRQMDSLNNHAELALLEAKRIGGNTLRIYHDENRLSSAARVNLESELRRAIQQKELSVYYQPKLDCQSNQIYGFEALVRWHHPERGIIPPAQFIPLAEETSLISEIGKLVLELSCAQIKKWSDLGIKNINVSVNVAAQQIQRGHLIHEIDDAVKKYEITSKQLELEITETSIMENSDEVKCVMQQLRLREIKVSLDDFGTGYSSLAYLALYPFDTIKIDRSFVSKIGIANQNAIVRAIIAMAKAMNKKVVAEGVETQEQYDFLVQENCDFLQGYIIGKPMPVELATDFLLNFSHTSNSNQH